MKKVICVLVAFILLFSLSACAPAEDAVLPSSEPSAEVEVTAAPAAEAWDGTDADTVETSEEHFIKAYNAQCNADPEKEDLLKDFGIDHIYTRTLPSGEVQTYVETEVTRTERVCGHSTIASVWDGTGADSVEVSEEYFLYTERVQCETVQGRQDTITVLGVDYTYTRTLPSGEVQKHVVTVETSSHFMCIHNNDGQWWTTGADTVEARIGLGAGRFVPCQYGGSQQDYMKGYYCIYDFSRTLPSGEVQTYSMRGNKLREERVCDHPKPEGYWEGADADSVEAGAEHTVHYELAICEINPLELDTVIYYGINTTYTRTLPSGEVQTYVETKMTRTERTCGHEPLPEEKKINAFPYF